MGNNVKTVDQRWLALCLCLAVAFMTVFGAVDAEAASAFTNIQTKGRTLFEQVKNTLFVLGGFGLVGLAVGAVFGKVNWKWFGALAFGLVVLAGAGALIDFMTGGQSVAFTDTVAN